MIPPSVIHELGKHLAFGAYHLGKFAIEKLIEAESSWEIRKQLNEAATSRTIGGSKPESDYHPWLLGDLLLQGASLEGANRPNLQEANLQEANLRGASLEGAD